MTGNLKAVPYTVTVPAEDEYDFDRTETRWRLVDETTAGTLNNGGALLENHLYMMTIEGRGVQATAPTTKLMVRGGYTIS